MTLVSPRTNLSAMQINANANILVRPSLVNSNLYSALPLKMNSGDIAVSRKNVQKLVNISSDVHANFSNAFPTTTSNLWNQNIVNGKYIIAYKLNRGLDYKLQSMLPKVSFLNISIFVYSVSWGLCLGLIKLNTGINTFTHRQTFKL